MKNNFEIFQKIGIEIFQKFQISFKMFQLTSLAGMMPETLEGNCITIMHSMSAELDISDFGQS